MIAAPMMIFIYFFLKIENQSYNPEILDEGTLFYMRIGILFIALIMVILATVAFKKQVDSINPEIHLRDKLDLYYAASITRSFLYEIATLTTITGMIISGEQVYVAYYTITLVAFSITYPTMHRIAGLIKLKKDEREILMNRKKIS
jgi:hypothetical protein